MALYLVNIYLEGVKFGGLKTEDLARGKSIIFSPVCKSVSFQGHFKHSTRRMARRSPSSSPFSLYGHHRLKNESHECTYLMSMELCYYFFQETRWTTNEQTNLNLNKRLFMKTLPSYRLPLSHMYMMKTQILNVSKKDTLR